jgi:lysophospholipase L1-like esterase
MNLDRVLPVIAPIVSLALRRANAQRLSQFDALPSAPGRVLFLGDSITQGGMWEGWFPELATTNRGINGDSIQHVRARLERAMDSPRAISLLIGTNDLHGLGRSMELGSIASQMRELVLRIRELAPQAPLLVNSIFPRSPYFAARIQQLNHSYQEIASDADAVYVDLWPALAAPNGAIRKDLTLDGIHLNSSGYQTWVDLLHPILDEVLYDT